MPDKIKLSKQEFDNFYEIEDITKETKVADEKLKDTTPEILTDDEQLQDDELFESLNIQEENV